MPYIDFSHKPISKQNTKSNSKTNSKKVYNERECYMSLYSIPKEYGNISETIYENYYVTDKGVVISHNIQTDKYIILKQSADRSGYKHVIFKVNGKRLSVNVHRLVLSTFNPIEDADKYQVNHIDENKSNNCIENLEWCTPQYNTEYSQGKQVACYKYPSMEYVATFNSAHDAARQLNLLQGEIVNVIKGRRNQKQTKGYTFKYV